MNRADPANQADPALGMVQTTIGARGCVNCGAALTGPFCARCGERAIDPDSLTVRHFLTHFVAHEVLHLDGKIWRTLRALLFRPGLLSAEFCAGRRTAYINPVRLLITAIIFYAILMIGGTRIVLRVRSITLSIAPAQVTEGSSIAGTIERVDRFGVLERIAADKGRSIDLESESVRARFSRKLETFTEPLSFTNMVLLALVLYALFSRHTPLLVHHAVFSMHLLSFVLVSTVLLVPTIRLVYKMPGVTLLIVWAIVVWQFAYVMIAIRRFYLDRPMGAFRRAATAFAAATVIYIANSVFTTAVQLAVAAFALSTL
jgi:Protein of unknown function (DUF3667)